ncbi:hypothetical protein JOB18_005249 [Solea senegalensis]|uniref:Uncharacterized protein n=1 Tax=Solea senegalensis TaxID=28829 RepID=A0AAV6SCL6_SOLSE|nr:hypothetical protein JOB18_005249 [Solea senegalensis]
MKVKFEERDLLFLTSTIFHVFQRTGAFEGLSGEEKVFYISRLVTKTSMGLTDIEGHFPNIYKAKTVAKEVIKELRKKFGDNVRYMLLEQYQDVEAVIAACMQRHTRKPGKKRSYFCNLLEPFYVVVSFLCGIIIFFILITTVA